MNKKMNNRDIKMERIARRVKITLLIAILCFGIGLVTAIPQQPYTLYGTATLNGKVLTAQDDDVLSLEVDGIELVSYAMGDISGTDNYVLKVPMDSDSSVTTAAQEGDTAYIYVNGIAINEGAQIIGAPSTTVQFDISATSAENPPSVTVRYPKGGESIMIGTQVQVSAHATDDNAVTSVTFYYSSDGSSNWNLIGAGAKVSGTDKDGTWNRVWNTDGLSAGTNYMIKAVASDDASTSEDRSDSTFSLTCTPPSSPTLNDPGTTDTDGNYTVSWSSVSGATSYTLEEDTSSSFSSPTVVHSGADTSKYITGKSNGTYYYRVKVRNACGCSGWSNVEYIVVSHEGAAPSVTVLYPNGGESIPVGTQVQISAHATDDNAVTGVTFYYSSDGGSNWNLIGEGVKVSGTDKDGAWNNAWNTDGLSAGTNYMINAVASDGASTGEDQSDGTFSLTGIQSQPSVKEMWRYKTNGIVWDVEIADIDNDNDSEVIVASDKLYVLNKLGSKERSFGQNIKSVEIGDINGDSIKDIIAGQSGGIITAYTGNGLEFWRLSLTTDFPKVIAVFDLNNDGLDEVLIASRECKFYMISGDGNILWIYSIGAWSDSDSMDGAIIDDIDNDNVFDIAIGGRDSKITALSGVNGCVIWEYAIPDSVGSAINAGDLNGDAYDDVVVGSWDTNVYAINGNNGSLLWKFVTPVHGHSPASVDLLGDINSDGTQDIAVGVVDEVYALNGKTGYQIWNSSDSFLGIDNIVTTDLNADEILDVCIGTNGCDPYANVYALNGRNGNTLWSFLEPESTIYGLTAGDIDKDGKNDIIAGSQDTYVYALTTMVSN